MQQLAETRQAVLVMATPHFVEVRFRPGVVIDSDGIAEIMRERIRLTQRARVAILVVFPEDADLDVAVINSDHYRMNNSAAEVIGLALVVGTILGETLANLYIAYYPPQFPLKVFSRETDAREWLNSLPVDRSRT